MKPQKYTITAVENRNGVITAHVNEIPSLLVQAPSRTEAAMKMADLFEDYLNYMRDALRSSEWEYSKMEFKKCDGNGKR